MTNDELNTLTETTNKLIFRAETILDRKLTEWELSIAQFFAHNAIFETEKRLGNWQ